MKNKNKLAAFAVAAAVLGLASAASAVPLAQDLAAAKGEVSGSVQSVDWRPYRHCHWNYGRRWCHGGYGGGLYWGWGRGYGHHGYHGHGHHGHRR